MTQLKIHAPARRPRGPTMTYEQFLEWDGENKHVEWVEGRVVPTPPISQEHNEVGNFLHPILKHFVEHYHLGVLYTDPFQMRAAPDLPGRAPDILFVANRNRRRLRRLYLDGPADVVVEIISPDSRTIDRVDKYREYEAGGVREYWIIDPARRQAEFYRRGRDGLFRLVPIGDDGVFRSAAMKGFWLRVAWLWQQPPLMEVLRDWKLV